MKKILVLSVILAVSSSVAVKAADNSTYSDVLLNQYTKNYTETEIRLREQQEARDAAIEQIRKERNEAVSKKLQEIEKRNQQAQNELGKKLDEINKMAEQNRAERNKKIEAQTKAIEDARKQIQESSNVSKEIYNRQKNLNEFMSH